MTAYIALLRGVNVGGAHMIRMADLKALMESLELRNVRTHLQSGNAVFAGDGEPGALARAIEAAIEAKVGFRPRVLLRSLAEMEAALADAPEWPDANPSRVLVTFLEDDPDPEGVARLSAFAGPESVAFRGREMWVDHLNGISNSQFGKLPAKRLLKTEMTGRNLNTVRALARMAAELPA